MKIGDLIHVRACKADGTVYRSWHTTIESVGTDWIVTISPFNSAIFDLARGRSFTKHILRSYYWFNKFYNLVEVFSPDGVLEKIYLNLASLPRFEHGCMSFTDYELDVSKMPHEPARLLDEDEFAEAILQYHYTEEFQHEIHLAAGEAMRLADVWQAKPVPDFGGRAG